MIQTVLDTAAAGQTLQSETGDSTYLLFPADTPPVSDVSGAIEALADAGLADPSDPSSSLSLKWTAVSDGITVYRFSQVFQGLSVYGREVCLLVDESGSPLAGGGNFCPVSSAQTQPALSLEEAHAAALDYAAETFGQKAAADAAFSFSETAPLVLAVRPGREAEAAYLGFLTVPAENGSFQLLISGKDGSVLSSLCLTAEAAGNGNAAAETAEEGTASDYLTYPFLWEFDEFEGHPVRMTFPYDLAYENEDGEFVYGDIMLPPGKTPFLMSQDDLNYYSYMIGTGNGKNNTPIFVDGNNDGFASKIVIDNGYPKCEYVDADGNVHIGDYDLVPILETFIQEHPDFSYRGARAILGVTGYEGVFGYRTKPNYQAELDAMHAADPDKYPSYEEEVAAAKEVAQCLRDHGWILASHSYGHPAYGNISADRVAADSDKWENTVEPIIGETDVILFPHGSDIHTWREYPADNAKFVALYEDGFRYFFNVDGNQYWNQLGNNYFRGGRRNVDGYRMYHDPEKLEDLFDVETVFDDARPLPIPGKDGTSM